MKDLKQLAVEKNCAVLIGSDLSRRAARTKDFRPTIFDFDSPLVPRTADEVLFLHQDYSLMRGEGDAEAALIIAKHPLMEAGSCTLLYRQRKGFEDKVYERSSGYGMK